MSQTEDQRDPHAEVQALLSSASWEKRLAEARESRRLILEQRAAPKPDPRPEPLILRPEWAAPKRGRWAFLGAALAFVARR